MAIMPGASRVQRFSGNRHKATVDKIVIHTTEGSGWPGYSNGGNAPHFTIHRNGEIRQHIDTAQSAKALVNKSGGVETNNDGVIQIENIGSCDRPWARKHNLFFWPDADDDDLMPLARVLAWIHEKHGVPLTTRNLKFVDTNIAYATAPGRMTMQEWRDFSGVCGHQHVPENHHWDPGKMPVQRAIDLAKALIGATADVPAADPSRPWKISPRVNSMPTDQVRAVQKAVGVTADGIYGDKTGTAVAELQAVLELTPDGVWGPSTEAAVSKLEEKIDRVIAFGEQNQWRLDRLPAEVWNHQMTLKGSDFEGKISTPGTKFIWLDHERESGEQAIRADVAQVRTEVQALTAGLLAVSRELEKVTASLAGKSEG